MEGCVYIFLAIVFALAGTAAFEWGIETFNDATGSHAGGGSLVGIIMLGLVMAVIVGIVMVLDKLDGGNQ